MLHLLFFKPHHDPHLFPKPDMLLQDARLISINYWSLPYQVCFVSFYHLRFLRNLPTDVEHGANEYHRIVRPERSEIPPTRQETSASIATDREDHCCKTQPSAIRLTPPNVWKVLAFKPLGFQGTVEVQVDDSHADIVDDLGSLGEICKPCDDLS